MHIQSPCLLLNTCLTVHLLKGRANCFELGFDRSAVYVELYLSENLLSTSTLHTQYSKSSVHSCIWLNIFWRALLSIILNHSSGPITKFWHFNSIHDLRTACWKAILVIWYIVIVDQMFMQPISHTTGSSPPPESSILLHNFYWRGFSLPLMRRLLVGGLFFIRGSYLL